MTGDSNVLPAQESERSLGRRGFLSKALLGGGLAWAAAASRADAAVGTTSNNGTVHTGTAISGVYDVSSAPYNAVGSGAATTKDGTAIQNAINDASKSDGYGQGGGIVYLPAGNYYLDVPLVISQQIILKGAGWGNPYAGEGGTMLIVPASMTSSSAITINSGGRGTILRDFAIIHDQPAATSGANTYTPGSFPAAILVSNSSDISMESLLLVNPTIGISLLGTASTNGSVGRISLNRIYGQPLTTGIYIDLAKDTITINNVHFWFFWSSESGVTSYTETKGVAIDSRRNDNPFFSNIFAQNYYKLFYFSQSPQLNQASPTYDGTTQVFHISNATAYGCTYGLVADADAITGFAANCSLPQCNVTANNVVIQFTNLHLAGPAGSTTSGSLFYVSDDQSRSPDARSQNYITFTNLLCEDWDGAGNDAVAIETHGASTVYIGGGAVFRKGGYPTPNQSPTVWYGHFNGGTLVVGE